MIRRIWAIVSDKDFYNFKARADRDGVTMGEAMATLAHMYGNGGVIALVKPPEHKVKVGVDYAKEHRLSEVDATLTGGKP